MHVTMKKHTSWLDRPLANLITLNWETIIFGLLLVAAIFTRFYDLESRVMSHDETSHVYFSWLFSQGRGYAHDPVTHGPLQFHLVALSYFMFGDNDFTARMPAALFSIATIVFMWKYRKVLGRVAALVAAGLLVISPYLLYYGRYVRNEAYVGLFGVITFWAILRYLTTGQTKYVYWLTAVTALHFATKETAFIYTAQAMIFLAGYLVIKLLRTGWQEESLRRRFQIFIAGGLVLFLIGAGLFLQTRGSVPMPNGESGEALQQLSPVGPPIFPLLTLGLGALGLVVAAYYVIRGYSWGQLRQERSFSLLLILTTMVLPMLAPFPVKLMGLNPIDYSTTQNLVTTGVWIGILSILAIVTGILWNWRTWAYNALLFYGIFIVFYTSVFTNGFGFITGLVGSLGYWLEQQGVNRGSQPWYYYWAIQIPIYEYLPAIGTLAAIFSLPRLIIGQLSKSGSDSDTRADVKANLSATPSGELLTLTFLIFWSITSLVAYTIAGEKMPWLTFHIALPMILTAAWFIGSLIENADWQHFRQNRGFLLIILLPVLFISLLAASGSLLGANPPFQGKELEQLRATSTFLTAIITAVISGWLVVRLVHDWSTAQFSRIVSMTLFGLLAVLTARAAFVASFINYDNATEYLVYAHSASGPKRALEQIEEISRRTTDGLAVRIAYDNDTTYPFWWYLRNYSNQDFFGSTPSRAQREAPLILVGEGNYGKIEPVVGQAYHKFEYKRIWWPNQDYFDLTRQRIIDAVLDPQMRAAIFQIWLNRDYELYAQLTNADMSLPAWQPSAGMRLYVRKDIIASLWNYGVSPTIEEISADPFEEKKISVMADILLGTQGNGPGQFSRARDLAVAQDGTVYVVDTENHRVQHLDRQGNVLHMWGSFADSSQTEAPGGTFFEPWGIAVALDGSVYVADTWNHRVQKFSPEGEFQMEWGFFGQAETPYALWGPRDVAVDKDGRVFVTDTGNKRVVVFTADGEFITEFGSVGLGPGQFDEPVGLAVDEMGKIYVADTWNQRVQVFNEEQNDFIAQLEWEVSAWYGQSLDNKPYLAVEAANRLYISDPEGYRVLVYTPQGEVIGYIGDLSSGADGFALVGGLAIDPDGGLWVADPGNNRVMHFILP